MGNTGGGKIYSSGSVLSDVESIQNSGNAIDTPAPISSTYAQKSTMRLRLFRLETATAARWSTIGAATSLIDDIVTSSDVAPLHERHKEDDHKQHPRHHRSVAHAQ